MSAYQERAGLLLSFSELTRDDVRDANDLYASSDEAFLSQSLPVYVADEVNAIMQIAFCEIRWCTTFYNPIYLVLFILLYILTFPGAALHWALLDLVPVRKRENPEERELRSQGIYTAMGVAIISIPFGVIGLYLGSDIMVLINEIALAVNCSIIVSNLLALKAMADELIFSTRVFAVGAWIIDVFLIGLALIDVYEYLTFDWVTVLEYFFRIIEIFVYTVIAVQCTQMWNIYETDDKKFTRDIIFCVSLSVLFLVIVIGFILAVVISEEHAWRIFFW